MPLFTQSLERRGSVKEIAESFDTTAKPTKGQLGMASPAGNESDATPFPAEAEAEPVRESEGQPNTHASEGKARVARYKEKQKIVKLRRKSLTPTPSISPKSKISEGDEAGGASPKYGVGEGGGDDVDAVEALEVASPPASPKTRPFPHSADEVPPPPAEDNAAEGGGFTDILLFLGCCSGPRSGSPQNQDDMPGSVPPHIYEGEEEEGRDLQAERNVHAALESYGPVDAAESEAR
mmetsp:Transcript_63520/g.175127  ORF Transcript_63520/g.175127 Transcript_63520/m.175127 type:complete len:236 (+) Transcript_63520:484-1191(+)